MAEKRRVHFNEFMIEIHAKIHELKKIMPVSNSGDKAKPFDPIPPVASLISNSTWLLCFDEFQVRHKNNNGCYILLFSLTSFVEDVKDIAAFITVYVDR
jgi:predicted ATPase